MKDIRIDNLICEIEKLHSRNQLFYAVGADYYEPGMMEYLEQSDGMYSVDGTFSIRFEVKGTRYEGRTEIIETVNVGDKIKVVRDSANQFNGNNFRLFTENGYDVGNMPAEVCNAIAPLYDSGELIINQSKVSFVEPISKRSRYAKQAILFIELIGKINSF